MSLATPSLGTRPEQQDPQGISSASGRLRRWPSIFVVAIVTIGYGYEVWQRRWLSDDGMIAIRTIRQLLAGNGPVFNLGERAETNTSTLWTYLVAAATWVTGARDPGHVAVLVGFVLSMAGLALGMAGTATWLRRQGITRLLVPAGALVLLALPPFWDFGTSGLETPLVFAWLGACWYLLCRVTPGTRFSRLSLTAFVFGLGWLVRPDMALVSAIFLPALWLRVRPSLRRTIGLVGIAAALPVGYEIFRAGYYGMLVPMPAISKEAGKTDWHRGFAYLSDLTRPYHLYIAVLLLTVAAIVVAKPWRRIDRAVISPVVAAAVAGLAMIGYVTAIGGDFMHGRMLLPGVFLLLLPVSLLPWSRVVLVLCCALGAWTVLCVFNWRAVYPVLPPGTAPTGVIDERQFYVNAAKVKNPDSTAAYYYGVLPPNWMDSGQVPVSSPTLTVPLPPNVGLIPSSRGRPVTLGSTGLGLAGSWSPLSSVVLDDIGLSYPLAGHAQLDHRGRPGHDKNLPMLWVVADLAAPNWPGHPGVIEPASLTAARHALTCGPLARMQHAVRDPMTPNRFLANLVHAFDNTKVVVPSNPFAAERTFCGSAG